MDKMDAVKRRRRILGEIERGEGPVSASLLAKALGVSRQIIVGDVALLRAQGHDIIATARGYIVPELKAPNQFVGKIASHHGPDGTRAELYEMVDMGAVVINVIVEHELYGEITGQLNVRSRADADAFAEAAAAVKLLSELTMGIHLHTIACRDNAHFEQVRQKLDAAGYLYRG